MKLNASLFLAHYLPFLHKTALPEKSRNMIHKATYSKRLFTVSMASVSWIRVDVPNSSKNSMWVAMFEAQYFDINDQPAFCNDGYAKWTAKFDALETEPNSPAMEPMIRW